jgi:histidinol-phosphatase
MPIITEAGGEFTDWRGRATAFGGDAIATNGTLGGIVREILAPASVFASAGGAR